MKRIVCLVLCFCIIASLFPTVSAQDSTESLSDCTVEVLFGAALTKQKVKRDAKGVYYAPITWISYFGPNVVHKDLSKEPCVDQLPGEGWHCFYLKEQEKYGPFARRTFINEKTGEFKVALGADLDMQARFVSDATDYGTWWECTDLLLSLPADKQQKLNDYFSQTGTQVRRISEQYITFTEGKFSRVVESNGECWVPMNEVLALTDVVVSVTGDGKYLCMQPVQDSLLRFLYRRWDELEPLVFDEHDIVGEDFMAAGGWIVATASGRGGFGIGQKIQSYTDLFTTFLTDDEAYLKAFDSEANADMEYMGKISENAGEINNIFQDISKELEPAYQLMISGEAPEMQAHYKSYFTPGKATSQAIGVLASLGQYAHVYLNQINDHREMLSAVYFYKADPGSAAYVAAKSVVNSYRDGSEQITSKFWQVVGETTHGIVNDTAFDSLMGPWYLYLKVGTLFMGDDYQYILDSSQIDENLEVSQYAYQIFKERIFKSQLKGLHPNAIRLSLMLSMVSSRHAYKTYWAGTDYKADTIAKIDEILVELYTAGRWEDVDSKDMWYALVPIIEKELTDLKTTWDDVTIQQVLAREADPSQLPGADFDRQVGKAECYIGSIGAAMVSYELAEHWDGSQCIESFTVIPEGEAIPITSELTTADTLGQLQSSMTNLGSWTDDSVLPPEFSAAGWIGPYQVMGTDYTELSCRWVFEDGNRYMMVVQVESDSPDAAILKVSFFWDPYVG